MNAENTSPEDTGSPEPTGPLPPLSDERVAAIEEQVFARIEGERASAQRRSIRRGRLWMGGAAAAAVIAVAAIIAPSVVAGLGSTNESGAIGGAVMLTDDAVAEGAVIDGSKIAPEIAPEIGLVDPASGGAADSAVSAADAAGREIIASSSATVVVEDVRAAAQRVADAAEARGGYVESMSIGSGTVGIAVDGVVRDVAEPEGEVTNGWISVRVPAEDLPAAIAELQSLGEVTASTVDRYDVTDQVVDLQARVNAAQASVDRLRELMAQSGSVADLIAAESALAERQASLESYQQQLESLENQVALSSLHVSLTVRHEAVDANPAGFWDGLVAGWNGLIATLNGIVIALGFLLPWIAVAAVIGGIVWAIVVGIRRGRDRRGRASTQRDGHAQGGSSSAP